MKRQRFLAIGCGGLALMTAVMTLAMGIVTAWEGARPALTPLIVAGIFVLSAFLAFWIGIRPRDEEDEDLFHGERGLAVALTIVVIVAVAVVTVLLVTNPGFWRGATGY
ncbi:MAG TPA: hypothetical protein VHL59_08375 [Thermoanaerobaculia bacterium]|nr:hypothetical protein [Thermoanaerobaculia bacterium]